MRGRRNVYFFIVYQQAVQAEVDGATQTACDLRQKMVEKDVALELTACHLRQQEAARSTLQEAITSALTLLHQAAFQVCMEGLMEGALKNLQTHKSILYSTTPL